MNPTEGIVLTASAGDKINWKSIPEAEFVNSDLNDVNEDKPSDGIGCCQGFIATPHLKAWILTAGLIVLIVIQIMCQIGYKDFCSCDCNDCEIETCDNRYLDCLSPCDFAYANFGWWLAVIIINYVLYLIECWFASSHKYLKNTDVQENVYEYVARLQTYPPIIWWRVECYHYETRTRTVSDGHGDSHTETYEEKVDTHRAAQDYTYASWIDISTPMAGLDQFKLIKISYFKTFTFANNATKMDYESRLRTFRSNNDFDTYQDFFYGVEIADFKSKMLSEVVKGAKPKYLTRECYLLSSVLGCTTCFRMWFASIVGRKKYTFNKQVNAC